MKKNKRINVDPEPSAEKKGVPNSKTVQHNAHEVVDECPKETKDCENCELIYCPEERTE